MPDKSKVISKKQTTEKVVVKKSNGKKETKAERFLRLAKHRVVRVLDTLRILGNCSNRTNYEYSSDQVDTMFDSISEAYSTTLSMFSKSKAELIDFKF